MTSELKDQKRLLVITEAAQDIGKSEIVKFAADYAYERQRIQVATYINLGANEGKVKVINMLDTLNLALNLNIYTQVDPEKYCEAICKKLTSKHPDQHIVLIFDNINQNKDQTRILEIIKSLLAKCLLEKLRCIVLSGNSTVPDQLAKTILKQQQIPSLTDDQKCEVLDEALRS